MSDPSPEEIAERCLEVQATWTPAERLKRLRVDLRPMFTLADGQRESMTEAAYKHHHETRAELIAAEVIP